MMYLRSVESVLVSWYQDRSKEKYFTGPISPILLFVSSFKGVDANTQTSPLLSFMAVERPPKGRKPSRAKGLHSIYKVMSHRS